MLRSDSFFCCSSNKRDSSFAIMSIAQSPIVFLVYDFETTGLSTKTADITQLAIMTVNSTENSSSYSAYFIPDEKIGCGAAMVTGISVVMDSNGIQILTRHGVQMSTISAEDGMREFVLFIERALAMVPDGAMALLVAHNGHRFDERFLVRYMQRFNLHTHSVWNRVLFGDSMVAARNLGYRPCSLANVHAQTCPDSTFDAHNATGDCLALIDILNMWKSDSTNGVDSQFLDLFLPKEAAVMMRGENDLGQVCEIEVL